MQQQINTQSSWEKDGFRFTALAAYSLKARVIRKREYWFGDAAALSPVDIVFAWGSLSDAKVLNQLKIDLGDRYYTWRTSSQPPLPTDEINRSMANVHLIPASKQILDRIEILKRDDIAKLTGFLVKAEKPDGWNWSSSTSRDDAGDGACELMWVDSVEKQP